MTTVTRRPLSARRLLVTLGTLAVVALGTLLGVDAYLEYQNRLTALKKTLETQTTLLAEHAQLSLAAAETVLLEVQEDIRERGLASLATDRAYWQSLRKQLSRTPQLVSLIVVDALGRVRLSSVVTPPPTDFVVTDRDYFQAHALGLYQHVGEPITGRSSGRVLLPVSLRLGGAVGDFQGVIMASLNSDYFQAFYSQVRQDTQLRLGMFRTDGTQLTLAPSLTEPQSVATQAAVAAAIGQHRTRTWLNDSPLDSVAKYTSLRRLNGYPVVVTAAYDYDALLATLYPAFWRNGLVFVLLAAGTLVMVRLVDRNVRAADHARQAELRTARLAQAIAHHLPNGHLAVVDRQLRVLFAEGQFSRLRAELGLTLTPGQWMSEVFPPSITAELERLAHHALAGEEGETEIAWGAHELRVFSVPIAEADGAIVSVLFLTQDITKLKQTQRTLEVLSATDGLLGIANRREFDKAFAEEWRRGRRDQQPLSLLLIDVDHFKRYNDTHGHLAGDRCLQRIAGILTTVAQRPGDLAARYGGEEMAILLPATPSEGAFRVAQRVHARLAEPHPADASDTASAPVTVSIGVATLVPADSESTIELIRRADAALYLAKQQGRNQTVVSSQTYV